MPAQWRGRLKRHFWRKGYFEALLQRLDDGAPRTIPNVCSRIWAGLETGEARVAVEGLLDMVGEAPLGARTREEIVERLIEQAADAAALRLDPKIAHVITTMLEISGPAPTALADIRALMKSAGVALEAPLSAMDARFDAIHALGIDPVQVVFAGAFRPQHGILHGLRVRAVVARCRRHGAGRRWRPL